MKELTLEATIENITQVIAFINTQLEAADCTPQVRRLIDVAVDELFSNIAYYAYAPQKGMATVRIDVQQPSRTVEISFSDSGFPYNPMTHQDPVTGLGVKERKAGGFGIYIVKKSMDSVRYEYVNGCNVITITKTI